MQSAYFGVQLPQVPERYRRVIRARREQPVIQEPGSRRETLRLLKAVSKANVLGQERKLMQR